MTTARPKPHSPARIPGPEPIKALIPVLALFLASAAWSARADRYPLREIDRPLVLPAKMWQERLIQSNEIVLEERGTGTSTKDLQGFWPSLPSHSFTDRLMWMAIPVPYFRYLLLGNAIDSAHGFSAKGLSLAVEGGLTGFAYSSRDGTMLAGALGLNAKRPLSSWAWSEGYLGVNLNRNSEKTDESILTTSAGLGFQLSDRFFLKPALGLNQAFKDGYSLYPFGALDGGVNFTPYLSLGLRVSLSSGSEGVLLDPGASLSFQW